MLELTQARHELEVTTVILIEQSGSDWDRCCTIW